MGIEDGIKTIQQISLENKQSLTRIQDVVSSLQGIQDPSASIEKLSMVLLNFEENLEKTHNQMRAEMNSILDLIAVSVAAAFVIISILEDGILNLLCSQLLTSIASLSQYCKSFSLPG